MGAEDARASVRRVALANAAVGGVMAGGWLAARELDDRPAHRRAVRGVLLAVYAAQVLGGELAWPRVVGPAREAETADLRELQRALPPAVAAALALWLAEDRAPAALARRGAARPHLLFGLGAGVLQAVCAYPLEQAQARLHLAERRDGAGRDRRDWRRRVTWGRRLRRR